MVGNLTTARVSVYIKVGVW